MKKRMVCLVLVLVFCIALFAGCGSNSASSGNSQSVAGFEGKNIAEDAIKIAYVPISTAGIMNKMSIYAFEQALAPYPNVTLDIYDPGYDTQTEITILNDCITQGYDAIICEITDAVSMAAPIREAEQSGIPVITINSTCDEVHSLHITGDDYLGGQQGAAAIAEKFGNDAGLNVVIIDVPPAMQETNLVAAGVIDYMNEYTNWNLLVRQGVENYSQEDANTAMRDILTKYEDVDVVFCAIDDLTVGVVQAIDAAGRGDGSIAVWGHMGYPAAYELLLEGNPSMYGLNWGDQFCEYSYAMLAALNFISTGYTAQLAGRTDTPEALFATSPLYADDAEEIYTITRWEWALEN